MQYKLHIKTHKITFSYSHTATTLQQIAQEKTLLSFEETQNFEIL